MIHSYESELTLSLSFSIHKRSISKPTGNRLKSGAFKPINFIKSYSDNYWSKRVLHFTNSFSLSPLWMHFSLFQKPLLFENLFNLKSFKVKALEKAFEENPKNCKEILLPLSLRSLNPNLIGMYQVNNKVRGSHFEHKTKAKLLLTIDWVNSNFRIGDFRGCLQLKIQVEGSNL